MGLAASQARLLSLTARQSDNEYEGQIVNNRRLALSSRMQAIAKDYSEGMSNKSLKMIIDDETVDFDAEYLTALGFTLVDASGQAITKNSSGKYVDNSGNVISSATIERLLRAGTLNISNGDKVTASDGTVSYSLSFDWRSDESGTFSDVYNTTDDAAVAAKYESDSAQVQAQDKKLELELKNLDTEHKAIETEMDAVKKVIEKNVQSSFKTFG